MKYLFSFFLAATLLMGCQSSTGGSSKPASNPMSPTEYTYFSEELDKQATADLKEGFEKEQVVMKSYSGTYKNEPANYKCVAYKLTRTGESAPFGLLIEVEVDRIYSSLMTQGKRNKQLHYYAVPSGKSPESLHNKYHKSLQELNYKDYEVYVSFLSRVLSELAL